MRMTRIVVIGGGVIGVTTAAELARRGLKVTLLERSATLGSGATTRNGGQLSYSYADALGSPAVLFDLPRLLCGLDPAVRIRASGDRCFWIWVGRFLANCTSARFSANTLAVLRLALRSRSALAALRARHPDLAFDYSNSGKLHLYDDVGKFEAAKEGMAFKNGFGCNQRALTLSQAVAIEPAVAKCGREIAGAIHSPIDEAGDSYGFTQSLAAIAVREYGLTILTGMAAERFIVEGHRIRAVATPRGLVEADLFVLAAGSDASALARTVEIGLPIYPLKGYSITLPATADSPLISITDTRARIVFCRLGKHVRIAGMADLGRPDRIIQRDRIDMLIAAARTCLPGAGDWSADPQFWTGLRPMTPDSRPIIGATPIANLFLNCGHGMLGWTLACGSAELAAAEIVGDRQAMVEDFSLARF
jgi:D-amino-acid dehydrogenase